MNALKKTAAVLLVMGMGMSMSHAQSYVNEHALGKKVTIAATKTMRDDTLVVVRGQVVRALGDEKYELQDSTGKVRVDIDDDLVLGQAIIGKTITVFGEIDVKSQGRVEIDAKRIEWR